MPLILRAIITGFGYKIGTEIAKYVVERIASRKKGKKATPAEAEAAAASEDLPEGLPTDPGNPGGVEAPARRPN